MEIISDSILREEVSPHNKTDTHSCLDISVDRKRLSIHNILLNQLKRRRMNHEENRNDEHLCSNGWRAD